MCSVDVSMALSGEPFLRVLRRVGLSCWLMVYVWILLLSLLGRTIPCCSD